MAVFHSNQEVPAFYNEIFQICRPVRRQIDAERTGNLICGLVDRSAGCGRKAERGDREGTCNALTPVLRERASTNIAPTNKDNTFYALPIYPTVFAIRSEKPHQIS